MSNDSSKFLKQLHAKFNTSEELIFHFAAKATAQMPVDKRRIIAGEANEVYEVIFATGRPVIVRISRGNTDSFLREEWAMAQARHKGIPVADNLLIDQVTDEKKRPLAFCVQNKLSGTTLDYGDIKFSSLDLSERQSIAMQMGGLMAQLHDIKINGCGNVDADGRPVYSNYSRWFDEEFLSVFYKYAASANAAGFKSDEVNLIENLAYSVKADGELYPTVLTHDDFALKHIMYHEGRITGVLDFGDAHASIVAFEFANHRFWFEHNLPLEWLLRGYSHTLTEQESQLITKIAVVKGIVAVWYYSRQDHYSPHHIQYSLNRTRRLLDEIKK